MEHVRIGSRLREQGRLAWRELSVIKRLFVPVCILTALYVLGISAILRADFYYIDDMARTREGIQGWENFSRYLDNILSVFIHTDTYLTDISPLPQLIAAAELALASAVVLWAVTGKTRFTLWEYAAVLPLGLSPYYLECLSYKFDAPYMALSVLAAVLPFLFMGSLRRFTIAAFLGTLILCTSYQASSGIFPMLTVLLAFRLWSRQETADWRRSLAFIGAALAGYAAGMLLFRFGLMDTVTASGYINKTGQMETLSNRMPTLGQFLPAVAENLREYFSLILADFPLLWKALAGLVGLSFLFTETRASARRKAAALPMALLAAAAMLALSFGLYSVLRAPLFLPRSMYGFGALLAFLAVPAASERRALPCKIACLALSWCFFVFAFTYGNALAAQKDYTTFRVQEVVSAVKTTEAVNAETPYIAAQIDGSIGFAPILEGPLRQYPVLTRMVPVLFSDSSWHWGLYQLAYFYGLPEMVWDMKGDMADMPLPVLDESMYHTLRGNEHFLHIILK